MPTVELQDGRKLAYTEYGEPDGAVVFAFHGSPGAANNFAPLDDVARRCQVRLIAPDRPGYGGSTFDPDRALVDWPGDVVALAAEIGAERFGVFGMSGGGPHSAVCGYALGDRLTGCAIVSGAGPLATKEDAAGMMTANRGLAFLARRAPKLLIGPFTALSFITRKLPEKQVLKQMLAPLPPSDVAILTERPQIRAALLNNLRVKHPTAARAAAQDFQLFAQPWGFDLGEIEMPVHIWQGDADVNVPAAHARRYEREIPKTTTHYTTDDGHLLMYDYAEDILNTVAGRT